ncbi:HemK2/MTQ2 family protein methyltransferase [Streptomyces sp. 3214.6]|uniref:HemK2/MTQ2 family protein methyltransferase n=1 Tax=Streptomyces sp. 3214.6 TaxID=1882757 RepID=UPI00090A1562|nr:HemK2/MTQ2 family protein methyltransferase [Streptomyces sp. 3214.6]SHI13338.1 release factor glutamine methyltransferase [Streptomyces sp. 3214.6]
MTADSLAAAPRLRCWVPRGVYPPQADTRLLERALRRERITGETDVLDLGTGSGLLAVEAARLGGRVTAVDISWRAIAAAWLNALLNRQSLRVRHGDLATAVPGRRFDLVTANPPYVPAPGAAAPRGPARAWDAGRDGRLLIDRICDTAPTVLRPTGTLLIVHSHLCGIDATLARLEKAGLRAEVVDRARLPFGRVLRSRLAWLREQGLTADGTTEELVVIRAAHP